MSYKDKQFRTPDPHYGVALVMSVQSDLITQEESNLIEIFISEVNALSQISESRKIAISSSGATLRQNHLKIIDTVLETSTVLIANPKSLIKKEKKIYEITLAFESVMKAENYCYLMLNAPKEEINAIKMIIPGFSAPTIMNLAESPDLVAIHAVVEKKK